MRVATGWADSTLTMSLAPEPGDRLTISQPHRPPARLVGTSVRFQSPVALDSGDVHPDVEALLALLVVYPFSGPSIVVTRGVSPEFAAVVEASSGRRVSPIDPVLAPRRRPAEGVVGLAFSGGVDSTAALAVLPPETMLTFLRRSDPPGHPRRETHPGTAAVHACEAMARRGRTVRIIESDVAHVRRPIGFTTDWVNGAGAILLAEHDRIDSLAWGLIAESAYRIGHERFMDWSDRQAVFWGPVFAAAGLPMCQPVAGVSEVGTASIVRRFPDGDVVHSCPRGVLGEPCGKCWKCFRKMLLDAAISGAWPSGAELDALFRPRAVQEMLGTCPIKHEDVMAWIAGKYDGDHPLMRLLTARTRADRLDLDWLTRFYGPSLDLVPDRHRASVTRDLEHYLQRMDEGDEAAMRAWDMEPMLADPATKASRDKLVAAFPRDRSGALDGIRALGRRVRRRLRG